MALPEDALYLVRLNKRSAFGESVELVHIYISTQQHICTTNVELNWKMNIKS